ncbi:MAG: septal ring lytic transglycosylase RlpA family protein [Blastocatellia bacterium]|nr:septal ring lytic transglycosylase RlpA family protein [Blastocatellia bacterium]
MRIKTAPTCPSLRLRIAPAIIIASSLTFAGCIASPAVSEPAGNSNSAEDKRKDAREVKETQTGLAAFYSDTFQGGRTYSGEAFNNDDMVAAHPSYPMGAVLRITNLGNDRAVEVRVIDRGPSKKNQENGFVIDLSRVAAERLNFIKDGMARVRVEVLEWGDGR